jgi:hypothetical protein
MAGIINTASAKVGDPLKPLDPGDFNDVVGDPDAVDGTGKTKPDPQTVDVNGNALAPAQQQALTDAGAGMNQFGSTTNPLGRGPVTSPPGSHLGPGDVNPPGGPAGDMTGVQDAGSGTALNPLSRAPAGGPHAATQSNLPVAGAPASASATGGTTSPATMPGTTGGTASTGAGASTGTGTGSDNPLSWNPTSGIVDQIQGITPKSVDSTGYTASTIADTAQATAEGYTATGYTAQQGTAETSNENVSQAVDRITAQNSDVMQRQQAAAQEQANARGLGNSSMAVQAGRAAVLDKAVQIAQGDVQNAQFNAAEKNAMTISNVHEANAAAAFHAQATNDAAAFGAAARNQVSQFNSAQSQQKAEFAAQQWDAAAAFSAQAKQAADTFNVAEYNKAMQSYMDAKNAAIAAQNDAVNLSRRDTAQINAGLKQAQMGADATVAAANAHASATVAAAQIGAEASSKNLAASITAQRESQIRDIDATNTRYNLGLTQQQQQFTANLNANQFNQFQSGLTNIMTSPMEPDAKTNAMNNYMSVWSTSGTLPFNINVPGSP